MSKAAAVAIEAVPVADIVESQSNHRRIYRGLDELAAGIRENGVRIPVLLRPMLGGLELVYGHRRLRASKLAEAATIPAIIREMSDEEAALERAIENISRADVGPFEEADAYRELEEHGYSPVQTAARVGRSKSHVYKRLQLAKLGDEIRNLVESDVVSLSSAELVARVADVEDRTRVEAAIVKEAADFRKEAPDETGPMDDYLVREILSDEVEHRLKDATWKLKDASLVPSAGACTDCPKASTAQPDLFAAGEEAVCTDRKCWAAKGAAFVELRLNKAKEAGHTVLSKTEAKKVLVGSVPASDSGYAALGKTYKYEAGGNIDLGKLVPADAPRTVAVTGDGEVVELVDAKVAKKAIAEAVKAHKAKNGVKPDVARDAGTLENVKCTMDIIDASKKGAADLPFLRALTEAFKTADYVRIEVDAKKIPKLDTAALQHIIVSGILDKDPRDDTPNADTVVFGRLYGVDVEARIAKAKADALKPAPAPTKPTKKKAK